MDNPIIENEHYSKLDQPIEESDPAIFIGFAFLVIWVISMIFLFNLNSI